jgi:hypothetical protein
MSDDKRRRPGLVLGLERAVGQTLDDWGKLFAIDRDFVQPVAWTEATRPLCPWCQRPLTPLEMLPRQRLGTAAQQHGWGCYVACEACAWDMDGADVPPLVVLH